MKKALSVLLTLALLLGMAAVCGLSVAAADYVLGDADGDGRLTSGDVRLVLLYAAGQTDVLDNAAKTRADYDQNGIVDSADARLIQQKMTEVDNIDYANVTKTDEFGNRSIAVLGDSITYGAAAGDIPNNSYIRLLQSAINKKNGTSNYGFTSVEGTTWGSILCNEIHSFPSSSIGYKNPGESKNGFTEYRTADLLGTKGLGSNVNGSYLTFVPKRDFKYFCVYYQSGPAYGSFTVGTGSTVLADVNGNKTVNAYHETATYQRTAFYDFSQLKNRSIRLTISGSSEVIFTGIGYYNELDGVVLNNYANGGLQLAGVGRDSYGNMTGLDEKFLALGAKSETLIFSLGYNDCHFTSNRTLFSKRIDYLIEQVNKNGCHLVVNDTCWYLPGRGTIQMNKAEIDWCKSELKRLAIATNGLYIDQQAINGTKLTDTISDGAHPTAIGHKIMADTLLAYMGLA